MHKNVIGPEELKAFPAALRIPADAPELPAEAAGDGEYLWVLGVSAFADGTPVTIRNLRDRFGWDPEVSEPCFYNQDWYLKEDFIDRPLEDGWFRIRRSVYEDSRAVQPGELMKTHTFPSAIRCVYAFFTAWYGLGEKPWYHDFVWCSDTDHNGDRIYVGKYHDVDGVNKNGFSIHRHLALRPCYGCID